MTEHIAKFSRNEGFDISFPEEEARKVIHPHTDSLMIEIKIANIKVLRVLVDTGSSADILFEGALRKLRIGGAQMVQVKTPLYGFAGDCVYTKGTITLPTIFGEAPAQTTRMVEFLVVDKTLRLQCDHWTPHVECLTCCNFYLSPRNEIFDGIWGRSYPRKPSDSTGMLRNGDVS